MLVKVSKVFAAFMNETAAKMGFKASAEVVYLSERENCRIFGSWADNLGDYDYRTGKYKAIAVTTWRFSRDPSLTYKRVIYANSC